jgi:hypothetical protein
MQTTQTMQTTVKPNDTQIKLNETRKIETLNKEDFDQALADLGAEVESRWAVDAFGPRRDIGPRNPY